MRLSKKQKPETWLSSLRAPTLDECRGKVLRTSQLRVRKDEEDEERWKGTLYEVVKHGDYYAVMRVNLIEYGLKFEKTVLAKFRTEKQAEAEISRRVDRDEEERIARRRGYKRQYDEDFKERRGKQIKRPHQVSKLLPSTFVLERTSRVEKPDNGNQANGQGGA